QVLRLACVYALLDRSSTIGLAHLEAALALWEYAAASARRIFGERLGNPDADRILAKLRDVGALTETEIHELFGRHKSAAQIGHALELLRQLGLVTFGAEDSGGRPRVIWRAVDVEKKEN